MKKFYCLAIGVFALCVATSSTRCLAKTPTQTVVRTKVKVDLSSPEKTMRTFVAALNARDWVATVICVQGAQPFTERVRAIFQQDLQQGRVAYTIEKLYARDVKFPARVRAKIKVTGVDARGKRQSIVALSQLDVIKKGDAWKIVPRSVNQLAALTKSVDSKSNILLVTATMVAHSEEVFVGSAQTQTFCTANLKQLAAAAIQMAIASDETFAFTQSNYPEKLSSYVNHDATVFRCPQSQKLFAFNRELENIPLSAINAPAQTVLFYEGKNGQLDFGHNERASVAFADGHVKAVSREEAQTLAWKP